MNRTLALALLAALLLGCLPAPAPELRWVSAPLDQSQEPADSRARIKRGDVVRVVMKSGKEDMYTVDAVDAESFQGQSLKDRKNYKVHYGALQYLEIRRWGVGVTLMSPR